MSQIDKSTTALQSASTGVTRAQQKTAAADHHAQEVQRKAMAMGFTGIAQGMGLVRNDIAEVHNGISAMRNPLDQATKAVAAAPKEGAPEQTVAALTPAQQLISRAFEVTGRVVTKIDETKVTAQRALQGGQPGPLVGGLEEIKQVMLQTRQHVGVAKQEVEAAIVAARQTGASGN